MEASPRERERERERGGFSRSTPFGDVSQLRERNGAIGMETLDNAWRATLACIKIRSTSIATRSPSARFEDTLAGHLHFLPDRSAQLLNDTASLADERDKQS